MEKLKTTISRLYAQITVKLDIPQDGELYFVHHFKLDEELKDSKIQTQFPDFWTQEEHSVKL